MNNLKTYTSQNRMDSKEIYITQAKNSYDAALQVLHILDEEIDDYKDPIERLNELGFDEPNITQIDPSLNMGM